MPRARRCADGEYPRCRVVVYRVIGYVLSAVNKLTKQEVHVEREIRARYAELMGIYDGGYVSRSLISVFFGKKALSLRSEA